MRSPELLVDRHGNWLSDPDGSVVGFRAASNLWDRERITQALPLNESGTGPWHLSPAGVLTDRGGFAIADPDGAIVGRAGVWVHRLVVALPVEDTR